jgi:hypothetical protein
MPFERDLVAAINAELLRIGAREKVQITIWDTATASTTRTAAWAT